MPYLDYLSNMKQYCNYYVLLYTAWCNVKRTVQARIQMQLIAKVPLSQKSPCSSTAVIPSYKCCLLGQVTLIHLHLSSMTEFSELGNGSQKVTCCDD